jgi:Flp pilus assembly protein CpaB
LGHVSSVPAASGWVFEGAGVDLAFVADELPLEKTKDVLLTTRAVFLEDILILAIQESIDEGVDGKSRRSRWTR